MKKLALILIGVALLLTACSDSNFTGGSVAPEEENFNSYEADFNLVEGYEKIIINPLEKPEDFDYYVAGTVEFYLNGTLEAVLDFGNGEYDDIATKTIDGETEEFHMYKVNKDFEKRIIQPVIMVEGWKYPVEGIVEFYKNNDWVYSINYGNGELDALAIITHKNGNKEYDMSEEKPKKPKN